MTTKNHKKHPPIQRPSRGEYGRNEIGLLGAPCDVMLHWIEQVSSTLSQYKLTYVDADHQSTPALSMRRLTDKITHHQLAWNSQLNKYDQHLLLDQDDLVVVNCNHFSANRQIVFCTQKKKESLQRKVDKLTDVRLVILEDGVDEPFDFLQPYLSADLNILRMNDIGAAQKIVEDLIVVPKMKALILAGGKSTRMGEDKGAIRYHGMSQVDFLRQSFTSIGLESYVSCRVDQGAQYSDNPIFDAFVDMGPFGAILSAFKRYPDHAWIVSACDMPLLNAQHFHSLLDNRDISKIATCFYNPDTGWPDPLVTLWEPKAYARLLAMMSLGYNCPRKVLINSDVQVIECEDSSFLMNANNSMEKEAAIRKIKS